MRLRALFQAVSAAVRAASRPVRSAARLALAPATLTYDTPTCMLTVWLPVVSNVTYPPVLVPLAVPDPAETVPPDQVPKPVGVRSNSIAKYTLNVPPPQKPPPVVLPVMRLPLMVSVPLRLPV